MKLTKTQLKRIIKEELENTISETCGPAHPEPAMARSPFQDRNVKVWELLAHMGLAPEQIDQVKDVLELNKAEAEVEDSFGIRLEGEVEEERKYVSSFYPAKEKRAKHLKKKGVPPSVAFGVADQQMAKVGKKKRKKK